MIKLSKDMTPAEYQKNKDDLTDLILLIFATLAVFVSGLGVLGLVSSIATFDGVAGFLSALAIVAGMFVFNLCYKNKPEFASVDVTNSNDKL